MYTAFKHMLDYGLSLAPVCEIGTACRVHDKHFVAPGHGCCNAERQVAGPPHNSVKRLSSQQQGVHTWSAGSNVLGLGPRRRFWVAAKIRKKDMSST